MEKWLFFRAAMAGLGKYRMGGFRRIGVYRGSQPFVLGLTSPTLPTHTQVHMYTCITGLMSTSFFFWVALWLFAMSTTAILCKRYL